MEIYRKLCRVTCMLVVAVIFIAARYSTTAFTFSPRIYHHTSQVNAKSFFAVSSAQASIASTSFGGKPFWSEGLNFSCTACGKCCQNKGDVWLNTEEFASLAESLKLPIDDIMQIYVEEVKGGWVRLKSKKVMDNSSNNNGEGGEGSVIAEECIFLSDDDHKTCTIYEQRPVQCRTYPYWSNLLTSRKQWEKERVDPVGMTNGRSGRNWSIQDGGCEGIEPAHVDSKIVSPRHIYLNQELYGRYLDSFPFMKSEYDSNRLKTTTKMMQGIIKSTKAWVIDFVVKYNLCPFAEHVFTSQRVRYATSLTASTKDQIIAKLREEVYYLLSHPNDVIETTLLVLPFAMKNFEDWYSFTLELEEVILPKILREIRRKSTFQKKASNKQQVAEGRLAQRFLRKKETLENNAQVEQESEKVEEDELQLACFHPSFMWSSEDKEGDDVNIFEFNHPMHFEKRAPFPTINILRSKQIYDFANQSKTFKIAKSNEKRLQKAGSKVLTEEFQSILQLALE